MSVSEWVTIREAAVITNRDVQTIYDYVKRGTIRSMRTDTLRVHREDVERLAGRPKRNHGGQVPVPCQDCVWRRGRQCQVFISLLPVGWQTPDGECEAHATPERRAEIEAECRAYAARMTRTAQMSA